jgi:hypothetical protein
VRNIAEGAGRWSQADSSKRDGWSRRSTANTGYGCSRPLSASLTKMLRPSKGDVPVHAAVAVKVHDNVNAYGSLRRIPHVRDRANHLDEALAVLQL